MESKHTRSLNFEHRKLLLLQELLGRPHACSDCHN